MRPGALLRHPFASFRGHAAMLGLAAVLIFPAAGCARRETLVQRGNVEKILHRSVGHELADLDPHLATQTSDYHVLSALFEGLVSEDPADLHPVPGVAESWDTSPDCTVFTFHLRSGARWSNGEPVTARDFLLSFKRVLSPSLAAENAAQLYILRGAEEFHTGKTPDFSTVGVEALDDRTLRLTLRHPSAVFLSMLNDEPWFPVHIPTIAGHGPVARRGNPWTRPSAFVGNGPFNLKEWSTNHRIVVTRSPTYWDREKVRLREIHFYPFEPDAEERAFRAGQLHVTDALPPAKIDRYRRSAPGLLKVDPLLGTYFYRINTRIPALSDARVRLALSLAVDRKAIVGRVLQGSQIASSSFTPSGIAGYEPPDEAKTDPKAARALLAEAGYPGGKGFPPVELLYNSSETHRQIAEAVQEMWRQELGITTRLLNMENTSV
ncbi:MAG: peptide ABC transporter substrate-binding protein, partial [Opitutaceae bacterium]